MLLRPIWKLAISALALKDKQKNKNQLKTTTFTNLPPTTLRYRVHGATDIESYLVVGKNTKQDLVNALSTIGKKFDDFGNILDFGCGCGRTLMWFDKTHKSKIFGTDIDAEFISWCKDNIDSVLFSKNDPIPPLNYDSNFFDFIFCISIFTHLNEKLQFKWLDELRRVLKTDGILIITFHGFESLEPKYQKRAIDAKIQKNGFALSPPSLLGRFFNAYQTAYHTRNYITKEYSKYFEILKYIPKGLSNHQDLAILKKS